jgi:hypothetical protein
MAFGTPFSCWLRQQQNREDPVGSLARFTRDRIELTQEVGPAELLALLTRSRAASPLQATVDFALHEWAEETSRGILETDQPVGRHGKGRRVRP